MDRTGDPLQGHPNRNLRRGFEYDGSGNVVASRSRKAVNTDPEYCGRFRIPGLVCTAVCVVVILYLLFVHQYHVHMDVEIEGLPAIDDRLRHTT